MLGNAPWESSLMYSLASALDIDEWLASWSGRFVSGQRVSCTQLSRNLEAGLNMLAKQKSLFLPGELLSARL
jgi:hypothetical protein